MSLVAQIRALILLILLASWSPVGIGAFGSDESHIGHLAISVFTRRLTRATAAEQFDPTKSGVTTARAERPASIYDRTPHGEGIRA